MFTQLKIPVVQYLNPSKNVECYNLTDLSGKFPMNVVKLVVEVKTKQMHRPKINTLISTEFGSFASACDENSEQQ